MIFLQVFVRLMIIILNYCYSFSVQTSICNMSFFIHAVA